MKSVLIFLLVIFAAGMYFFFNHSQIQSSNSTHLKTRSSSTSPEITSSPSPKREAVFVPYWTIPSSQISTDADRLIYFGITVNSNGVDETEDGYRDIPKFLAIVPPNNQKYLTLRMIDQSTNIEILKSKSTEENIISQTLSIAKQNNFTGVLLDYETASLSFDPVVKSISDFVNLFDTAAKAQHMPFAITLYGDTFYRSRPFDVPYLSKNSDEIFIMAYDFDKARGNPGPNFPFGGANLYGYDFQHMIHDFKAAAPTQKLTVVFGMYGYDWMVDSSGQSTQDGESIALTDIEQKFINSCSFKNCSVHRDPVSAESEVKYTDSNNQNHEVWFEDNESVATKEKFLQQNGINSTAMWAYTYY